MLCICALAAAQLLASSAFAQGQTNAIPRAPAISPLEAQTLDMLLAALPSRYASAQPRHDTELGRPVRLIAQRVRTRVLQSRSALRAQAPAATTRALDALDALVNPLGATTQRYQPWPLSFEVDASSARARHDLGELLHPPSWPASPYHEIGPVLDRIAADLRSGRDVRADALRADALRADALRADALRAYALYASGPGRRLQGEDPSLDAQITKELLVESIDASALAQARSDMSLTGQVLGLVKVSHTTIVVNGAIIVFREGLEAVLILAALTASFIGVRRRLRRPVLIGALLGLAATVLTWVIAQMLLHLLGDGGLQLQAITGLVAIGVLLLITNWFFHRVYWSEWISRFNRRRKALEQLDRAGFLSGQVVGLVLLGISSTYREGLETVLFLQALQTSAGMGTAALGAGIGLAATLIVGVITFKLQRKLPFKRMLILTGVLIALVLAVMVGTTVHNMQGIGWLPTTTTSFNLSIDWSMWLGVYPTWEGIAAQLGALVFVIGSYFAAREIQINRPKRRASMAAAARRTATPLDA